MRVSYNWLKDYVGVGDISAHEIAGRLTTVGLEVCSVKEIELKLDNVVAGLVKEVKSHPHADKLSVCQVDTGNTVRTIVCGAPNVVPGIVVPVVLPVGKVGDLRINKAKIGGIESDGMICSEKELGLSDDADGIMLMPPDVLPSTPLASLYPCKDYIIDIEITRCIAQDSVCQYDGVTIFCKNRTRQSIWRCLIT